MSKYTLPAFSFGTAPAHSFSTTPLAFSLEQNYPNPFNPATKISFTLPSDAVVDLAVYNMLGQEVATVLHGEEMTEGAQEVDFNGASLPSGAYFYRIKATVVGDDGTASKVYTDVKRMMLVK